MSLRFIYDNNILDYSHRDRNLFLNRIRPNKFSITTLDDLISELSARIERKHGTRAHGEYRVRVTAEARAYARNAIKNSVRYELEGRWAHGTRSLMLHAGWVPHFYLRDLTVPHDSGTTPGSPSYANANYGSQSVDLEYRSAIVRSMEQRVSAGWKYTDYGQLFDERDNTTWWASYGLVIPLANRWKGSVRYEYATTSAAGADDPLAAADISRREQTINVGFDYDIPKSMSGSIDVVYEHQRYTSTKPSDLSHAGRRDHEWRLNLDVSAPIGHGWRISGFDHLTTATSTAGQTAEFGAFDDNQVGMRVAHAW